jgi:hypothetical protein
VAVRGLALPAADFFETPLGRIPLDKEARNLPHVVTSDPAHALEHSLEVQLPFLQRALGTFSLVPLAVGRASVEEVAAVLERLWGGPETLVVVSTDLSHYHAYDTARAVDAATVAKIAACSTDITHEEACGATPLNGLLSLTSAYHAGPDDPGADHGTDSHPTAAQDHTGGGAHGDDHHPVQRPRYAGLVSLIGPGVLVAAFGLALAIFFAMRGAGELHAPFVQRYYSWLPVGDLLVDASFQLDQLSMVMVLIITGVGALIHLFSVGYMQDDPGYPRYFAYLILWVFFMLGVVLGASFPSLFIGW